MSFRSNRVWGRKMYCAVVLLGFSVYYRTTRSKYLKRYAYFSSKGIADIFVDRGMEQNLETTV